MRFIRTNVRRSSPALHFRTGAIRKCLINRLINLAIMRAMSKRNKTIPGDEAPGRRERLLTEASRIFALKGFDKASTREIAQAAGANIGLIAYYFGDKLGLYREVMMRPVADVIGRMPEADANVPLRPWLESFYGAFLQPLQLEEAALASLLRLCGREMIEPSAVYQDICAEYIAPRHLELVQMLAQRCGVAEVDTELHQLAFGLVALAHDYWMSADHMEALVPGLVRGPGAYERVLGRLVGYGEALIEHERALRQSAAKTATVVAVKPKRTQKAPKT
ncbi:CerR family C-terminal domain-containing protein [Paucibacter sp. DJ1R-11]|uniref:CerR family C-terminal domain-containing protein n=1 Tax=Paucibacter sp. DJ1R-11 TaxID=2893556 RepID=UPI0021E46E3A|nr:CerR family C-terminal domain-containing protein [Paucibacter sp. DJ1R-11]MCV2364601.1 CerR family C-terminal domain-containing protein [Paucibacter sp. DJ1R-11]